MDLNAKTAALILGVVFVFVGILAFIPNPIVSPTGIFAVDTAHILVHLVSGSAILAGAYSNMGASLTLKVFGVIYAAMAILGFIQDGNMLIGMIHSNRADTWLHLLVGTVLLAAGFVLPDDKPTTV